MEPRQINRVMIEGVEIMNIHLKFLWSWMNQEFGTRDHDETLNIVKGISDPIDIEVDVEVAVTIDGKVKTNIGLKLFLNESVVELIHFMAKIKEVRIEEIDEFVPFSFDSQDKA
ncbi:hypothetical protein PVK06_001951 [Gossypium arboreum]|uniref:Uncharacterized protein n=1 Tax=Gossypium arboreum TaxID=29729 RepID=A0ABR0R3Q4_GOSAR|nr:hypothetical protein PVK06_001951 [Gossypium arboreum]